MTVKPARDQVRIAAMIEAAEEARADAAMGEATFMEGGLLQKAVLLDLIHLTEAADRVSAGFKKANPRLPWDRLARLRNRGLVHDYAQVDLREVWRFVRDELPRIRRQLDHVKLVGDPQS